MKHRFLFIIAPMLVVFVLHVIVGFFSLYDTYPDIDIPMHFLGGFVTAMTVIRAQIWAEDRGALPPIRGWVRVILGVACVTLVAVAWEFYEFLGDQLISGATFQVSLADTMGDLAFGIIGGAVYLAARRQTIDVATR